MVLKSKYINTTLVMLLTLFYSQSTPWPKTVGLQELVVGLILIILFSKSFFYFLFNKRINLEKIIFIYFLIFGTFLGIVNNTLRDFIRDFVPFFYLYFGIFIFYTEKLKYQQNLARLMTFSTVIIGLVYSFRTLFHWKDSLSNLGKTFMMSPDYIAQSPSLTFSSSFLLSLSILLFIQRKRLYASIVFILGLIPLIIFFAQVLRAPVGLVLIFFILHLLFIIKKFTIQRKVFILSFMLIFLGLFINYNYQFIESGSSLLMKKNEIVGSSGKLDEYIYAYQYFSNNLNYLIFGKGFGGLWLTPFDVKEYSFAHSILVYYYIKGGIIGFILMLLLTIKLFYLNTKLMFSKNQYSQLIAFATFPTLVINCFLEPGYKTLSFSFIILIIYLTYKVDNANHK